MRIVEFAEPTSIENDEAIGVRKVRLVTRRTGFARISSPVEFRDGSQAPKLLGLRMPADGLCFGSFIGEALRPWGMLSVS